MPLIETEIKGLLETQRKLEQVVADLRGQPMLTAMRDATLIVQRSARQLAPVDTGRLRASITPEVRGDPMSGNITGVVGSNVEQAAPMELGTKPHFPPLSALQVWARRHGVNAYAVARAIALRGLKPRRYLQGAFEQNRERVVQIIGDGVAKIVNK